MTPRPSYRTDARGVVLVLDLRAYRATHPEADVCTCGECGRSWDDAVVTGWTPAPSARCPFEGMRRYRPRLTVKGGAS